MHRLREPHSIRRRRDDVHPVLSPLHRGRRSVGRRARDHREERRLGDLSVVRPRTRGRTDRRIQ